MIKGIFFDWFNTLAHYDPPREEVYIEAFKEQGIKLSFETVYRGLLEGDRQYFALRAQGKVKAALLSEMEDVLLLYPMAICKAASISVSLDINTKIIRRALKNFTSRTVLFEDVIPIFNGLKKRNYLLGIITNADQSVIKLINGLGLSQLLNIIITSEGAHAEKPDVAIFNQAYLQAGLTPDEMLYLGDQYESDVLGAKKAGSPAILVDRYNLSPNVTDCSRISSLNQLMDLL